MNMVIDWSKVDQDEWEGMWSGYSGIHTRNSPYLFPRHYTPPSPELLGVSQKQYKNMCDWDRYNDNLTGFIQDWIWNRERRTAEKLVMEV
jgi:hypothetical protein